MSSSGILLRLLCVLYAIAMQPHLGKAQPPEYLSFDRKQRRSLDSVIASEKLLQIWVIHAGDGEAILIRHPQQDNTKDRTEILVNAGAIAQADVHRVVDFVKAISKDHKIDFAILSTPDDKNIHGLTRLINTPGLKVGHVYHNGLAYYKPTVWSIEGPSIFDRNSLDGTVIRGLGPCWDKNGQLYVENGFLVDHQTLGQWIGKFALPYSTFAKAVAAGGIPTSRIHQGSAIIPQNPGTTPMPTYDVLWPPPAALPAFDPGEACLPCVTGNSIVFRLEYGDFQFLSTSSQTPDSIEHLVALNSHDKFQCDVLKIPGHGANPVTQHGRQSLSHLYRLAAPVLSIATSEPYGADQEQLPAVSQIRELGNVHRVYSTHRHERVFDQDRMKTDKAYAAKRLERTHILIETDGHWFRLAEVQILDRQLTVPKIKDVRRGDGTRWIRTKDNGVQ